MKKLIAICLILLLVLTLFVACSSSGEPSSSGTSTNVEKSYELHAAYTVAESENSQHTIKFNKFKEIVEEKTNGKVKIIIHPGSELGSEREYIEMMQSGELAFASVATSVLSGFTDALKFYDTPMLFTSQEQLIEFTKSDIAKARLKELEEIGLVGLAAASVGSRNFLTVEDKPINSLADIQGLKIRTMETDIQIDAMKMLGGNPTPMAYNECYQSLQTGVIDGMENEPDTYLAMRFYEVAPNYSQVGWLQLVHGFIGSKSIMDTLPLEYQNIILDAAVESSDYATQRGIEYGKEKAIPALKEEGANVIEIDNTEFIEKLKPLIVKYKDTIGQDVIDWISENS